MARLLISLLIFCFLNSFALAATVAFKCTGKTTMISSWPSGTPFEILVRWDPAAGVKFDKGEYDKTYSYSYSDGSLMRAGFDVDFYIGNEHFVFSSLDPSGGRTGVNLIDEPGTDLDRLTLWAGERNTTWDIFMLEFGSVNNDSLINVGNDWTAVSFDFSGDYQVRMSYALPDGSRFILDVSDMALAVPEPESAILLGLGIMFVFSRRGRSRA